MRGEERRTAARRTSPRAPSERLIARPATRTTVRPPTRAPTPFPHAIRTACATDTRSIHPRPHIRPPLDRHDRLRTISRHRPPTHTHTPDPRPPSAESNLFLRGGIPQGLVCAAAHPEHADRVRIPAVCAAAPLPQAQTPTPATHPQAHTCLHMQTPTPTHLHAHAHVC